MPTLAAGPDRLADLHQQLTKAKPRDAGALAGPARAQPAQLSTVQLQIQAPSSAQPLSATPQQAHQMPPQQQHLDGICTGRQEAVVSPGTPTGALEPRLQQPSAFAGRQSRDHLSARRHQAVPSSASPWQGSEASMLAWQAAADQSRRPQQGSGSICASEQAADLPRLRQQNGAPQLAANTTGRPWGAADSSGAARQPNGSNGPPQRRGGTVHMVPPLPEPSQGVNTRAGVVPSLFPWLCLPGNLTGQASAPADSSSRRGESRSRSRRGMPDASGCFGGDCSSHRRGSACDDDEDVSRSHTAHVVSMGATLHPCAGATSPQDNDASTRHGGCMHTTGRASQGGQVGLTLMGSANVRCSLLRIQ